MTKALKSKPRARGVLPAGWTWREGRPRWIPSPTLRAAGWRGHDLKDKVGAWLGRGASIDAAEAIVSQVSAWRRGAAVEAAWAELAPPGAPLAGAVARKPDRLSIGALIIGFTGDAEATPAIDASPEFNKLARATQRDYRGKLKRLVDVLAGYVALPAKDDAKALATYAEAVAAVRATSVLALAPEETDDGLVDLLYDAYWALHAHAGVHQASGVLAVASVWLAWCRERQSRTIRNWAGEVSRETPPGRLRSGTWEEIEALVRAADRMGLRSIGDAIVLGLDLSWSQVDRLALTWDRVREGRAFTARQKTGRKGGTPLLELGAARVAEIRLRQDAMAAQPTHVLWCELTDAPWNADLYRKKFARVRAEAANAVPSVAGFTDADLRDTAFTWSRDADLTDDETASRTLQSRKNIAALGDKHYGEIGPAIADRGRDKLNAMLKARGVKL